MNNPRISVCVPYHEIELTEYFLARVKESLEKQTYQPFEVIYTKNGKMAENTNSAIKQATGDIVKILFMDDYLLDPDALKHIAEEFKGGWLATGCIHDSATQLQHPHLPSWSENLLGGQNFIGSPSVIAFENNNPELFDENLSWLLDCDLYHRLGERYGLPTFIEKYDVAIGIGMHQTTHTMSDEAKLAEHEYIKTKYGN